MKDSSGSLGAWQPVERRWAPQVAGLGLVGALSWLLLFSNPGSKADRLLLGLTITSITAATLILIVLRWEGESLSTVGIHEVGIRDLGWMVILGVAAFGGPLLLVPLALFIWRNHRRRIGSLSLRERDWPWVVVGVVAGLLLSGLRSMISGPDSTAASVLLSEFPLTVQIGVLLIVAITEEIIFRGYVIERLYALTGRLLASAGIALVYFLALHIPAEGWETVLSVTSLGAIALTLLYIETRNLGACVCLHFLINSSMFLR